MAGKRALTDTYSMDTDIGGILKRRRLSRNETLEDVAFRADTDAGNLSRIERNKQELTVQRLGRLCDALEMTLADFFQELEGRALSDPAAAFDKPTRELLSVVSEMNPAGRAQLVEVAQAMARYSVSARR
ncbi:helix-turn-helix domain-containing protein, partial [Alcanivorax xiamenensis]